MRSAALTATPVSSPAGIWISAGHALPFYPNAITLSPDVTAAEATAGQDPSRPFAVKDSFARLDLAPEGLTPLFDAEWIALLRRRAAGRGRPELGDRHRRPASWPAGRPPGPAAAT